MAYTNGIIPKDGNVDLRDVQRALRSSLISINSLAQNASGTINKWAKYKPQAVGGVEDISERDRSDDSYGLNVPIREESPVKLLHRYLNGDTSGWWEYRHPGNADTKRFTDFAGYNGKCTPVNTDPNPEGRMECVNVMEREGEYEGQQRTLTFGVDYPTKLNNVDWPCLLNPSNLTSGVRWHFCVCIVPEATLSTIESPYGGDGQLQSMWSNSIKLIDPTPISASHKGGGIDWQVPYPSGNSNVRYVAIYCFAEGVWSDGEFQFSGQFCPVYGNFYKEIDVARHIDNRADVLQIGWIAGTGSHEGAHMEWHDMAGLGEINPRTADVFFRIRLWRTNAKVGFGDVVAQAFNSELCNGVAEVRGLLAVQVDSQPLPQVSASGQASSITIPAIGSSDSYYPWGRAWVETADYAEFVWQFPNLWPNINNVGGRHSVTVGFYGKWGDALTQFASKIIVINTLAQ